MFTRLVLPRVVCERPDAGDNQTLKKARRKAEYHADGNHYRQKIFGCRYRFRGVLRTNFRVRYRRGFHAALHVQIALVSLHAETQKKINIQIERKTTVYRKDGYSRES